MGVHGLTTYLRANNAIAQTLQFTSRPSDSNRGTFVVDGWSFIYEVLALLDLPWVYGGEYGQLSFAVQTVVRAWLSLGLRLYFVFDGPFPKLKFPTITSRMTENNIKPSLLFFRTSPVSRSKPKFLRESGMLPPRAYTACVQTLRNVQTSLTRGDTLELNFADEEGDPYAVELAARLGGFVVGKDSDFVILNAEGYQGYIPLDEMIWSTLTEEVSSVTSDDWEDDDGFQTVVNSKSRRKAVAQQKFRVGTGHGLIPPDDAPLSSLQLSVTVYSPTDLAAHLGIPLSLLPLLAALVGNDFTGTRSDVASANTSQLTNLQWLFFDRQLTLSQRILRVASTLRNTLSAALSPSGKKGKNREKDRVTSVMQLIDRAVAALIVRNVDSMASGEKERVVERVVEATLQYAIPKWEGDDGRIWSSDVCALHEAGTCPLVLLQSSRQLSQAEDTQSVDSATSLLSENDCSTTTLDTEQGRIRALYVSAYRSGYMDPHTLDVLHSGTFWYRQFLEDPDLEPVARTFARPIMLWTYAILDDSVGIPQRDGLFGEAQENEQGEDEAVEDDDELIDVIEENDPEDEDPLAPLRGALQQLNGSAIAAGTAHNDENDSSSQKNAELAWKRQPSKVVEEHIRRGTRLAGEDVEILSLMEMTASTPTLGRNEGQPPPPPLVLRSLEERCSVLLCAVGTTEDRLVTVLNMLNGLPSEQRVPLLTLRSVLSRLYVRARESGGSKEREKEKWTKQEAQAFLASFAWSSSTCSGIEEEGEDPEVPITDRNVQLTAQVLATMDAIERLSECLLLSSPDSDSGHIHLPSAALLFSGKTFHAYLSGTRPIPAQAFSAPLWDAACEGLDNAFGERSGKKRKKDKTTSAGTGPAMPIPQTRGSTKSGSKYGLLASMSVD
ncbi:hypothetical protein BC835DRAFT_1289009 [Cytidiella melzeri]|nr:hypothetical protein BC835DRAFT_1289009 [Cytidiella melzeri]